MDDRIENAELRDNKDQRTPCALILDTSDSMRRGGAIDALNRGLQRLETALKEDETASTRVQLLVIGMGGAAASVLQEWTDAINFAAPTVIADGLTPMGGAVELAMQRIEDQKNAYRAHATTWTRPWLFLMSDGGPNDDNWEDVAERARRAQENQKFVLFPVGVGEEAQKAPLESFSAEKPMVRMEAAKFEEMFEWLSDSLGTASGNQPGAQVALPSPDGWGKVAT